MKFLSILILVVANVGIVCAQPRKKPAAGRNRTIANIVREIDARNIEASIRKLVSFGTRNTLSEQNDPKRGIGAARDWLYAEFLKAAEASQGRMTVEKQSFEQAKAPRVPQPTIITNVVATLKGTQPEATDRIYVVSGHYDSMCGSPTDAKCDAPGANDDASGTAAVLEMAGLRGRESVLAGALSGGWKQRLGLGCAILHEPPIVFLDEPTGGVDPLSRRRFWQLINGLARNGTTVLVTTHYLDEAEHCHRIAIIHAGRLAALGTVS